MNSTFSEQVMTLACRLFDDRFTLPARLAKLIRRDQIMPNDPYLISEIHYFHSPAFLGLAAVLWEDIVEKRVLFAHKNVSSLTTNVHIPLRKVLSPKTELLVSEQHKQYQLINGTELAAMIEVPAVPAHLLHLVLRGAPKLHSLYGHRIFRYEVQEPFRKMVAGDSDYRVIKLESGQSELAEILGFKGKKAITLVGEILYETQLREKIPYTTCKEGHTYQEIALCRLIKGIPTTVL